MKEATAKLYPARKVRDRFGISSMTLWRWVRRGILPQPKQISGRNYFPADAVDALASAKQVAA